MEPEKILNYIRKQNESHPVLAERGLDLKTIAPGQLHFPLHDNESAEIFYLVLRKCGNYYLVIPGSLHGRMAGGYDIVLPKNVMGDYIFLSLDLAKVLPASTIAKGFARLDETTFSRVEEAYDSYRAGEPGPYPFALPYASENDPMAKYHEEIRDIINQSADLGQTILNHFQSSPELSKCTMLFPRPLAIARDTGLRKTPSLPFMKTTPTTPASDDKNKVRCRMPGYKDFVFLVEYLPADGILKLLCQAPDGSAASCFDSWRLADDKGVVFCEIRDGKAEVCDLKQWNGALCLVDGKQCIHVLIPE